MIHPRADTLLEIRGCLAAIAAIAATAAMAAIVVKGVDDGHTGDDGRTICDVEDAVPSACWDAPSGRPHHIRLTVLGECPRDSRDPAGRHARPMSHRRCGDSWWTPSVNTPRLVTLAGMLVATDAGLDASRGRRHPRAAVR